MREYSILEIVNQIVRQAENLNHELRFCDMIDYDMTCFTNHNSLRINLQQKKAYTVLKISIDSIHRKLDTATYLRILNYSYERLCELARR